MNLKDLKKYLLDLDVSLCLFVAFLLIIVPFAIIQLNYLEKARKLKSQVPFYGDICKNGVGYYYNGFSSTVAIDPDTLKPSPCKDRDPLNKKM